MDVNFRDKIEERNQNAAASAFVLVFLAIGVALFSPGMLVIALLVRPLVRLDVGQMWIFSVLASFVLYGGLHFGVGKAKGPTIYGVLCGLCVVAALVAHFGLHQVWPSWLFNIFTKGDMP